MSLVSDKGAVLSECGTYRYKLWRIWDKNLPAVTFIGLNPSTADASVDDQTVRRCIGFAKDWGYGGFNVVNLFAFRSRDPLVLEHIPDPIGPENDRYVKQATGLDIALVVAAWGEEGGKFERSREMIELVGRELGCLGYTKSGDPRHPSRARKDSKPVPYPKIA